MKEVTTVRPTATIDEKISDFKFTEEISRAVNDPANGIASNETWEDSMANEMKRLKNLPSSGLVQHKETVPKLHGQSVDRLNVLIAEFNVMKGQKEKTYDAKAARIEADIEELKSFIAAKEKELRATNKEKTAVLTTLQNTFESEREAQEKIIAGFEAMLEVIGK